MASRDDSDTEISALAGLRHRTVQITLYSHAGYPINFVGKSFSKETIITCNGLVIISKGLGVGRGSDLKFRCRIFIIKLLSFVAVFDTPMSRTILGLGSHFAASCPRLLDQDPCIVADTGAEDFQRPKSSDSCPSVISGPRQSKTRLRRKSSSFHPYILLGRQA